MASPGRPWILLTLLAGVALAGCTGPDAGPPVRDRGCLGPAGPEYSGNARLVGGLAGDDAAVARRVTEAVNDTLPDDEADDSATFADGSWQRWTTGNGTVTVARNADGGLTKVTYQTPQVWAGTAEAAAREAIELMLDHLEVPSGPTRQTFTGANDAPPVDFLHGRWWQRVDGTDLDGTMGTLTVQVHGPGSRGTNDTTVEVVPLYNLTGVTPRVTWGAAVARASTVIHCVFERQGRFAGDTSSLSAATERSLAVRAESLMWRVVFTYGEDCDSLRERIVFVDAATEAVHSVTEPRIACIDRDH